MGARQFIYQLIFVMAILLVGVLLMHDKGEVGKYTATSIVTIALFALVSIFLFIVANKAVRSTNKYLFNQVIIINMIIKMVLCVGIVFVFKSINPLSSKAFSIPLIIIFISFTIFESYYLTRIVRTEKK